MEIDYLKRNKGYIEALNNYDIYRKFIEINSFSKQLIVFTSKFAGNGKTFQIRKWYYLWTLIMWGSIENKKYLPNNNFAWNISNNVILIFEIPKKFFSFDYYIPTKNGEISKYEDQDLIHVSNLFEFYEQKFKLLEGKKKEKRIEIFNDKSLLYQKKIFKSSSKLILEHFNTGELTFRLLSNFWMVLKYHINLLMGYEYLDPKMAKQLFQTEEKGELFQKKFIDSYFLSVIKLIYRSFDWTKLLDNNLIELKESCEIFKEILPWEKRDLFILILKISTKKKGNQEKVENLKYLSGFNLLGTDKNAMNAFFDLELQPILKANGFKFNEPLPKYSKRKDYEFLFSLFKSLSLSPSQIEIENLISSHKENNSKYVLTNDNFLKMIFIQYKLLSNLPIILIGETGCGKTSLVEYLCETIMKQKLILFLVNGKTKRKEIYSIIENSEKEIQKEEKFIIIFFDEFNTAPKKCLILMKSLFFDRTLNGKIISPQIKFIAAGNPYRLRNKTKTDEDFLTDEGLIFDYGEKQDEMKLLRQEVYRVHQISDSFFDDIFDFGNLKKQTEKPYIEKIIQNSINEINSKKSSSIFIDSTKFTKLFTELLAKSFNFLRYHSNDKLSAVSLRDCSKTLKIFNWLLTETNVDFLLPSKNYNQNQKIMDSFIISLFISFGCQFNSDLRLAYFKILYEKFSKFYKKNGKKNENNKNKNKEIEMKNENDILKFIEEIEEKLIKELDINVKEWNVAINQALKENIFLIFFCCYTQIPLFLIGKPGSSKSISINILMQTLKPPKNSNPILKELNLPALKPFYIQCSPITKASEINNIFKKAREYSSKFNSEDVISVVILDEVALAEVSPDLPLSILHSELEKVDKKLMKQQNLLIQKDEVFVSIISVSNWKLDPSQTNRGILLKRVDPSIEELSFTAQRILFSFNSKFPKEFANKLAQVYYLISNNQFPNIQEKEKKQNPRYYFGLRDFYYFLKMIGLNFSSNLIEYNNSDMIWNAIYRNFGSKPHFIQILQPKIMEILEIDQPKYIPSTFPLIQQNLTFSIVDNNSFPNKKLSDNFLNNPQKFSRHLMILSNDLSILPLIISQIKNNFIVLFGSSFAEDKSRFRIIQNLKKVEYAVSSGQTIILYNNEQLYEPLYDLLNQNYIREGNKLFANVSFGDINRNILVDPKFRIIVIIDKTRAYDFELEPILNRFEKQIFISEDFIKQDQIKQIIEKQTKILGRIEKATNYQIKKENLIINYNNDLFPSLALKLQNELLLNSSENLTKTKDQIEKEARIKWIRICRIDKTFKVIDLVSSGKLRSSNQKLLENFLTEYKRNFRINLQDLFNKEILKNKIKNSIILTCSSIIQQNMKLLKGYKILQIDVSNYDSDKDLEKYLKDQWIENMDNENLF
ncbi:hypothetical protein M0811_12887 [Anaeramoeba ignava]|uniref:AAA+ ATPase domain-containing protein n=1 Tax=Anaeramoeba ignava TaxID=1746090 RepID=A0A9Q0LA48_ANAIG|nr:hypothetical protein M0811_12887 [Anaeramoeba ignava]